MGGHGGYCLVPRGGLTVDLVDLVDLVDFVDGFRGCAGNDGGVPDTLGCEWMGWDGMGWAGRRGRWAVVGLPGVD